MRRLTTLFVGLLFLPTTAWGQPSPAPGNLASQPGWGGFAVVHGRLAVLDCPPRFEKHTSCAAPENGAAETICIKAAGHCAAVEYEFTSPQQRLTIHAVGDQRVEIHRVPQHDAGPVELHLVQKPGKDLVLTIGAGDARREFTAPSFWRLMLAEPDLARDCLIPLLESLRPDWGLRRQTASIEQQLFQLAAESAPPDSARWEALVEQLGDPSFVRRETADRQLRGVGQPLATFLEQLDRRRLEPEQQVRIRAIEEHILGRGEDTPGRVASRLLYDQSTWLILLAREDALQRTIAARHLCKLSPEAISFDPQADQTVRRTQLRQLRQQLAGD